MLDIYYQNRFKKDYAKAIKRGCKPENLQAVLDLLVREQPLPPKYCDHSTDMVHDYRVQTKNNMQNKKAPEQNARKP